MNQYIQLRNNTYHFRFKVPHHLRSLINRTEIIRTLKTDSHQLACIKVSAKSALIYQLKNAASNNHDELVALFAKLLDFSEQRINIDSRCEITTTDQFQQLFSPQLEPVYKLASNLCL